MRNLAERGLTVGLLSLEDRPKWLVTRHVADLTGIAVNKLATNRLRSEEHHRALDAAGSLYTIAPRILVQGPERRLTPSEAAQVARSMVDHGAAALFLDHLGELDVRTGRRDRHDLDLDLGIQEVRRVATDRRVPFVLAAHLRRRSGDVDGRFEEPSQQSFAESAYIERKARVAVGLWQERGRRDVLNAKVLKNTFGAADVTFQLGFDPSSALVANEGGSVEADPSGRRRRGYHERGEEP